MPVSFRTTPPPPPTPREKLTRLAHCQQTAERIRARLPTEDSPSKRAGLQQRLRELDATIVLLGG
jgi:hypothetical protein